jgi:hypothetical protein
MIRDRTRLSTNSMSPAVAVALSGGIWFLAVTWFDFVGGPRLDLPVAILSGVLVMLFTLLLLVAPRLKLHRGSKLCAMSHCSG